jgi:GTP pyrophosphokinase
MPKALTAVTDDEKKLIRRAYQRMLKSVKAEQFKDDDRLQILKAYKLAVQAQSQQRRKSGEPYVLHPIEVARICVTEIGLGPTAIICALLHDVVEDTEVTLEEIQKDFGDKIATIVDGLTKLDGLYNVESPRAENFRKVITTLVDDVRVVLSKWQTGCTTFAPLDQCRGTNNSRLPLKLNTSIPPWLIVWGFITSGRSFRITV